MQSRTYLWAAGVVVCTAAAFAFAWRVGVLSEVSLPDMPVKTPSATVFAAGDIMLDRTVRTSVEAKGGDYIFSCIDRVIGQADFAVANLEGPITDNASLSQGSAVGSPENYYFTFATTSAALLARHNIRAVDLGNNHILNFGVAGLASTKRYLDEAGVGHFGGVVGDEDVYETMVKGVPVAFVSYNEFGGSKPDAVAERIQEEVGKGYRVVVYAHWGEEYVDSSSELRPIAEQFADAGAAAVVGAHPHVVLPYEYIGDTLVYYSLGNFIFDQYFDQSVDHGLVLLLNIPKEGRVTAREVPVVLGHDRRTCPAASQ